MQKISYFENLFRKVYNQKTFETDKVIQYGASGNFIYEIVLRENGQYVVTAIHKNGNAVTKRLDTIEYFPSLEQAKEYAKNLYKTKN